MTNFLKQSLAILIGFALYLHGYALNADVVRLKTESRLSPALGIDAIKPSFSWETLAPEAFCCRQTAYRIQVASSISALEESKPDFWDSGVVESPQSFNVVYDGKPLESSRRYYWSVTVSWVGEDIDGKAFQKEERAFGEFVTGVLNPDDWRAEWITSNRKDSDPTPILFKRFTLDQKKENVVDAILHVCGLGQQIVSVNARRVGDRTSIDPGWTNYRKTCLYTTFDVKKELLEESAANTIGVMLGNGMYNVSGGRYVKFTGSFGLPKMIAQLVVRYKDGTKQIVSSDDTWQTIASPVTFSCVYGGDDVDFANGIVSNDCVVARGVLSNAIKTTGPGGALRAQQQQPVVVLETLDPVEVKTLDGGVIEANFGFNFAGRPVATCAPCGGKTIKITLAEIAGRPWNGHYDSYAFNPFPKEGEGSFFKMFSRSDEFGGDAISGSDRLYDLGSIFGYWGFQYVYIEGAKYDPDAEAPFNSVSQPIVKRIQADRIGADLERVGSFESDGQYLNEIDQMIDRSIRSNIVSLMTDCPHREKLGWLEETHLMGPSILYRYDMRALMRKICRDIAEAQLEDGMIPDIAPEYTRFVQGFFWSPEWSSASVQLPMLLYRWYGDEEIIREQYECMDRYVRYMASTRNDKGMVKAGLGDWYDWSPEKRHAGYSQHTPGELTATAFLYDNARIMEFFAQKLDKSDDVDFYRALAEKAKADFQREYYDPETGKIATGSQAAYSFALHFDLIPEDGREKAFSNLLKDIEDWNYRPSCGEVAWPFLIKTLAEFGRNDVLWEILQREDAPGYVHMLKRWGMKTLSETWDGPGSSMNHFMFGAIQEWFSSDLAGIRQTDHSTAFSHILLRPFPLRGAIANAKGAYHSNFGVISSDWRVDETTNVSTWNLSIPFGSRATLEIPVADENAEWNIARVDGNRTRQLKDLQTSVIKGAPNQPMRRIVTISSGVYKVVSQL